MARYVSVCFGRNVLEAGKPGEHKDLNVSDKGQIVLGRTSPKQSCGMFSLCSGQYLTKVFQGETTTFQRVHIITFLH